MGSKLFDWSPTMIIVLYVFELILALVLSTHCSGLGVTVQVNDIISPSTLGIEYNRIIHLDLPSDLKIVISDSLIIVGKALSFETQGCPTSYNVQEKPKKSFEYYRGPRNSEAFIIIKL